MIYINRRQGREVETVDEYPNRERMEAIRVLREYQMSDPGADYYRSTRCTKAWKESK